MYLFIEFQNGEFVEEDILLSLEMRGLTAPAQRAFF